MLKASAVCCYENNRILSLTVLTRRGKHVTILDHNNRLDTTFDSFQELYKTVLILCKENGFKIDRLEDVGWVWYDVLFYNTEDPSLQQTIAYRRKGESDL